MSRSWGRRRRWDRALLLVCAVLCLSSAPSQAGDMWGGIKSGTRIFFEDLWYMVSAPARLDRTGWLQTAGAIGVGTLIYAYDREILDAFQRAKGNDLYDALLYLGRQWEPVGNMGNTNVYYLGAAAVGWLAAERWPSAEPLGVIPTQILETHITSGGIRNVARFAVGRRRPFEDQSPRVFEPGDGTSFPSGHASVAFELAGVLSHHGFRTALGSPIWAATHFSATSICLERIDSESHWPSDVYFGALLGTLTSRTVTRRWDERAREPGEVRRDGPHMSLSPMLGRTGGGLRLEVSF